jgi:hypothetical protein
MRRLFKKLFPLKVDVFNPDHSFRVNGVSRWRLCRYIASISGVFFTRKPGLLGSSAFPYAEFRFRDIVFQMDEGGDTGGDGLWVTPKDGQAHPVELREIREHIERCEVRE